MFNLFKNRIRRSSQKGSVAIEMLFVLLPCLMLMFMFFNLLLLLGNLMLSQSSVNRTIQQVAATGCMPDDLSNRLNSESGFIGVTDVRFRALATNGTTWNHDTYIDDSQGLGTLRDNPPDSRPLPDCDNVTTANQVRSGAFIYIQIEYDQVLFFMPIDRVTLRTGALSISNTLEGEG